MVVRCVWEHNGDDTLLYAMDEPGAYARGATLEEAQTKMPAEIRSYLRWCGDEPAQEIILEIVQEKQSNLQICDADSDVIFDTERSPLSEQEYQLLKERVLRSARHFQELYDSIPDVHSSCLDARKSFYGQVPRTAEEMYLHTRSVNAYYFGEIGVEADNEGSILECRLRGFEALEKINDFLQSVHIVGSYGEEWSVRKVLRRFLWHDRIHARAMLRMARHTFPDAQIPDPFRFNG